MDFNTKDSAIEAKNRNESFDGIGVDINIA